MKCTNCNINEANTHIKKIINGHKEEMYLCSECAEKLGVMEDFTFEPFSTDNFFGNLLGAGTSALNSLMGVDMCPYCGSTLKDIVDNGRVGCAHCYEKFEDRLIQNIKKIHGNSKHIGKTVSKISAINNDVDENVNTVDNLKNELKLAIKEQRFEDAAVLRDKIKELSEEA